MFLIGIDSQKLQIDFFGIYFSKHLIQDLINVNLIISLLH